MFVFTIYLNANELVIAILFSLYLWSVIFGWHPKKIYEKYICSVTVTNNVIRIECVWSSEESKYVLLNMHRRQTWNTPLNDFHICVSPVLISNDFLLLVWRVKIGWRWFTCYDFSVCVMKEMNHSMSQPNRTIRPWYLLASNKLCLIT